MRCCQTGTWAMPLDSAHVAAHGTEDCGEAEGTTARGSLGPLDRGSAARSAESRADSVCGKTAPGVEARGLAACGSAARRAGARGSTSTVRSVGACCKVTRLSAARASLDRGSLDRCSLDRGSLACGAERLDDSVRGEAAPRLEALGFVTCDSAAFEAEARGSPTRAVEARCETARGSAAGTSGAQSDPALDCC